MTGMPKKFSFFDLFDVPPISLVDVGAAPNIRAAFYQPLLDRGVARVTGFEPDGVAFAKLQARQSTAERYLRAVVGDGTPGTFYKTSARFTSSLYEPNQELCDSFKAIAPLMKTMTINTVQTQRLDDLIADAEIDFIKLDVQGAELRVLKGAPRLLPTTLLAEIEVAFVPLYKEQPLFADVDAYMRACGFYFHKFAQLTKLFYSPRLRRVAPPGETRLAVTKTIRLRFCTDLPVERKAAPISATL